MSLSALRVDLILQIWLLPLHGHEVQGLWVQGREERSGGGGEGEGEVGVLRTVRTNGICPNLCVLIATAVPKLGSSSKIDKSFTLISH